MDEMPGAMKADSEVAQLWGRTEATLREGRRTVGELIILFGKLNNRGNGSGALNAAVKQLKFQFRTKEIADLRARIASHQQSFQTAMAAMTWLVDLMMILDCPDFCRFLEVNRVIDFKKIEIFFTQFEEKFDSLAHSVKQLRQSQDE
jgi:hypothetical protein